MIDAEVGISERECVKRKRMLHIIDLSCLMFLHTACYTVVLCPSNILPLKCGSLHGGNFAWAIQYGHADHQEEQWQCLVSLSQYPGLWGRWLQNLPGCKEKVTEIQRKWLV